MYPPQSLETNVAAFVPEVLKTVWTMCWKRWYTSYDELPLMLSVAEVAAVLGISRAGAYELVHGNEFPALKIGSRIVVPKDKFLAWIDANSGSKNAPL